jgi:hypothetical protein
MPKPAKIVAALGDVSAIDSYATLQAEMVDLFTSLADCKKDWNEGARTCTVRPIGRTAYPATFGRSNRTALQARIVPRLLSQCTRKPKNREPRRF